MTEETTTQTSDAPQSVSIPATITVKRFAEILSLPVTTVITELMKNHIMATINEEIDYETASIIAEDLGFAPEPDISVGDHDAITLEELLTICNKERESGKNLRPRPPIVTILGHVDHGKTTLLDTIRKASVAEGEAGGITQHISAYQVKKRGKTLTFIDTPGHAAFAAMRERGASIADIAILIVAADDGIRPQTKEVIEYLNDKKITTIVAINKIDKPTANVAKVKQELAEHNVLIEEWGGKVMVNEISAKTGTGINDLLDSILLLADVEDFRADEKRDGLAVVLEAHMDPQKGAVATVVVKTGTLKVGQDVSAGTTHGRIRRIEDYSGRSVESAPPSSAVTLYGLSAAPQVNDVVQVMSGKQAARAKAQRTAVSHTLTQTDEDTLRLPIILKGDVQGSLEAVEQICASIPQEKIAIQYIDSGVGDITESDIKLAQSANAIIYGFNVHATSVAKRLAEDKHKPVTIKTFSIIYKLVDDIKAELLSHIPEEILRTDIGNLSVRGIFRTEKDRMIIGGLVTHGYITKDASVIILRDDTEIGTGRITNLQEGKVDVPRVETNKECGLTCETTTRIKKDDILKLYTEEVVEKSLS